MLRGRHLKTKLEGSWRAPVKVNNCGYNFSIGTSELKAAK